MNDYLTRARKALQRLHERNEHDRWTYGTVGRLVDGVPTFDVPGRSGYLFVTIRQANGAQTTVPARNDGGVPKALGLPVRMRREGTTYVIDSVARRDDLAYTSPGQDSFIHTHDSRYFTETEHISVSTGASDAGKPIKLDAGGKLDASLLDGEDIADVVGAMVTGNTETDIAVTYQDGDNTLDFVVSPTLVGDRIHAASSKATPVDADELGIADSAASWILKKLTWANLKATLKTYLDTLYVALTGAQTVAGEKTFSSRLEVSFNGTGGALWLSDSDVAHGMTTLVDTDVYGRLGVGGGLTGGLQMRGLSDSDAVAFYAIGSIGTTTPTEPVIVFQGRKVNGTSDQALASTEILFQLLTTLGSPLVQVMGDGRMSVGLLTTPSAQLHILQGALGSAVQRLQTTSSGDDPTLDLIQNKITTTNATVTTLHTFAIPSNTAVYIEIIVLAMRTGGSAGTAQDCACYLRRGAYVNKSGTVEFIGTNIMQSIDREENTVWNCDLTISGTNVLLEVTGDVNNNISWALVRGEVSQLAS